MCRCCGYSAPASPATRATRAERDQSVRGPENYSAASAISLSSGLPSIVLVTTPDCSRILASIAFAMSLWSRRNCLAFSRPWPRRWLSLVSGSRRSGRWSGSYLILDKSFGRTLWNWAATLSNIQKNQCAYNDTITTLILNRI
jgi:hypothetical protein